MLNTGIPAQGKKEKTRRKDGKENTTLTNVLIENQSLAKQNIIDSLIMFERINRFRPNSILQQMFFQSKNDEIFNLFINYKSSTEINNLKDLLNRIAPFYSNKWNKL